MALYSELNEDRRGVINTQVNARWGQLYELEKEWGERALKYLFATNAGGAIATLGFMGAAKGQSGLGTKAGLFLFVLGIVFSGITTAKTYHHMSGLFEKYKASIEQFYTDAQSWEQVCSADKARAVAHWSDNAIAYSAFGCFIVGCVVGSIGLFS